MSRETFDKCLSNQTIIEGLTEVKQRGRQFGVFGTPTFFINGRRRKGAVTFDEMKALIEQARRRSRRDLVRFVNQWRRTFHR